MNIPIVKRQQQLLARLLRPMRRDHATFMEIGCGEGHNLELCSRLGMRGVGVDPSKQAIQMASQRHLTGITLVNEDFLELHDIKEMELVLLLLVLEHIEDDDTALRKLNVFMAQGGTLILSVPAHSRRYSASDQRAGHYRRYDRNVIVRKLTHAGFAIEEFLCFGFPIGNLYTWAYNSFFSLPKSDKPPIEISQLTGIREETSRFPEPVKHLLPILFPLLSTLMPLDYFFLNTDLGSHYMIVAKKVTSVIHLISEGLHEKDSCS